MNKGVPAWMTDAGLKTLSKGYLQPGETPKDMYQRLASEAAKILGDKSLEQQFFNAMWNGWLCPASPVMSNFGTDRGLPISCYASAAGDSLHSIMDKAHEIAIMSKYGGGVGLNVSQLRPRGSSVKGTGGHSDGVAAWVKMYDSVVQSVSQGGTRRGSAAAYLPIAHPDVREFMRMRRPTGDVNARIDGNSMHLAVTITDDFMRSLATNKENRELFEELISMRFETGEPYIMFSDAVNRANPPGYVERNMTVQSSNLCSEITGYTDPEHSFVCCLSSLNLVRYDEWKDKGVVGLSILFLEAVMTDFIERASKIHGFESAVRFAEKSRMLGLGVLGWHTLLQTKSIPFDSPEAMFLNAQVFKTIRDQAVAKSKELAVQFGEPEWCKGTGMRHTHLTAIAPTSTNSIVSGGFSPGIEPLEANFFVENASKGTFINKNPVLVELLEKLGHNTPEVWSQINKDEGSVQNLPFLTNHQKEVFQTAREINQFSLVRQAGQRQKFIDQAQSLNLFFAANSDHKYICNVHLEAWRVGVKSLYYFKNTSNIRADLASRQSTECKACEA